MRILLSSFVSDELFSGMGKWSHYMARELEHLGHETKLWFRDDFRLVKRMGRLSVLFFPMALAFRLWRERTSCDVFVVHEPGGFWYGLLRRLVPSLPPMVLMCHNVESKVFSQLVDADRRGHALVSLDTKTKTPLFRLWQSDGAIRLADAVVCLSSFDREYLIHRFRLDSSRVTLMINGVSGEFFQKAGAKRGAQRVLFVGGWLDIKGCRLLPALWREVRRRFPEARLTIVGSGGSPERVLADFSANDRNSVDVFQGLKSESDMLIKYASHDVFLMPSLSEGSPLSLLEAMASGLPVVATRVGGIPNIITHERDGLLFDPTNPSEGAAEVCRLLATPEEANRFARAGHQNARQRTWGNSAQALLAAIESVVAPVVSKAALFERASVRRDDEVFSGPLANK